MKQTKITKTKIDKMEAKIGMQMKQMRAIFNTDIRIFVEVGGDDIKFIGVERMKALPPAPQTNFEVTNLDERTTKVNTKNLDYLG